MFLLKQIIKTRWPLAVGFILKYVTRKQQTCPAKYKVDWFSSLLAINLPWRWISTRGQANPYYVTCICTIPNNKPVTCLDRVSASWLAASSACVTSSSWRQLQTMNQVKETKQSDTSGLLHYIMSMIVTDLYEEWCSLCLPNLTSLYLHFYVLNVKFMSRFVMLLRWLI